jgi:hypothetical protein
MFRQFTSSNQTQTKMMTNMKTSNLTLKSIRLFVIAGVFITGSFQLRAQSGLSGTIVDRENHEAIPFANVALYDSTGTTLAGGAASNLAGVFKLDKIASGNYNMMVSALGYETYSKQIELNGKPGDLGMLALYHTDLQLDDVDVVVGRIKAKSESDQTTFFVSKKMQDASNTGTDILKLLPGVQVDLQQNISLEGSQNIIVLVNGMERDRSYLSQLQAEQIDRVELITTPPARYDASVTGVLNIVLTDERNAGMDGHIYLEVPVSASEVFLTPAYSLNYGIGKLNLFTSYNGEFRYFDVEESYHRTILENTAIKEIRSIQSLQQKTWSHRFHYGFDYFLNPKNELNFYAFYNPYSQELDGSAELQTSENNGWMAEKEDDDINHSGFYSLFYKHLFDEKSGHELSLDASWHHIQAENTTTYSNHETGYFQVNSVRPENHSANLKLDYSLPFSEKSKLIAGFQTRLRSMKDRSSSDFQYDENRFAVHGAFYYSVPKLEMSIGFRLEASETGSENTATNKFHELLPNAAIKYNITSSKNLKLTYRRSVSWPGFYQLNPIISVEDPFTRNSGNPDLQAETHNQITLEFSQRFNNQFLSTRLFYQNTTGAIQNLMSVNENGIFEIRQHNLGELHQAGVQVNGALSFGKFSINPYLKIFDLYTVPGQIAREYLGHRHQIAFDSGLSAFATFKNKLTASVIFQYASPLNDIQGTSFSDPLYFLSLEKTFAKGFKAGVVSGIPFAKKFTYHGTKIMANDFESRSTGTINMSSIPLWLKLSYQFSAGKKCEKMERSKESIEPEIKKGF